MATMTRSAATTTKQSSELAELRARLGSAEDTLAAIRNGEVDARMVVGPDGGQVFALKGAERPYRLLLEAMNEGAATVLPDGTMLYCNRRFASMAGRELDQMIGVSLMDMVPVEERQLLRDSLKTVPRNGCKAEFNLQCGSGGTSLPVQLSLSAFVLDDLTALTVLATDLTERKKHEQALLRQNEELERRVEQRTKDLKDTN